MSEEFASMSKRIPLDSQTIAIIAFFVLFVLAIILRPVSARAERRPRPEWEGFPSLRCAELRE